MADFNLQEFHEDTNEVFPLNNHKTSPGSGFSSGLLAAAVAVAVTVALVAGMYVKSSALTVLQTSAQIRAQIINSDADTDVYYLLVDADNTTGTGDMSIYSDTDRHLQTGIMEEDDMVLSFSGLSPGKTYNLIFYSFDEDRTINRLGGYTFTTNKADTGGPPATTPQPVPSSKPDIVPTPTPTPEPTATPVPTPTPTPVPSPTPTATPAPTAAPTTAPTAAPTVAPTVAPTTTPTAAPAVLPEAVAPSVDNYILPTNDPEAVFDISFDFLLNDGTASEVTVQSQLTPVSSGDGSYGTAVPFADAVYPASQLNTTGSPLLIHKASFAPFNSAYSQYKAKATLKYNLPDGTAGELQSEELVIEPSFMYVSPLNTLEFNVNGNTVDYTATVNGFHQGSHSFNLNYIEVAYTDPMGSYISSDVTDNLPAASNGALTYSGQLAFADTGVYPVEITFYGRWEVPGITNLTLYSSVTVSATARTTDTYPVAAPAVSAGNTVEGLTVSDVLLTASGDPESTSLSAVAAGETVEMYINLNGTAANDVTVQPDITFSSKIDSSTITIQPASFAAGSTDNRILVTFEMPAQAVDSSDISVNGLERMYKRSGNFYFTEYEENFDPDVSVLNVYPEAFNPSPYSSFTEYYTADQPFEIVVDLDVYGTYTTDTDMLMLLCNENDDSSVTELGRSYFTVPAGATQVTGIPLSIASVLGTENTTEYHNLFIKIAPDDRGTP